MNLLFLASTYVALDFLPQVNEVDKHNSRLTRRKLKGLHSGNATALLVSGAYVYVVCMCHMFTSVGVKVYVYMHVYTLICRGKATIGNQLFPT